MSARAPRRCEECDSTLAGDQRYCLGCGVRAVAPSAAQQKVVAAARDGWTPRSAPAAAAPVATAAPAPVGGSAPRLRLPPPRIAAVLVAAFLGFGVLLGDVAATPVKCTLASDNAPLKVLVPSRHAPTSTTPSGGSAESSSSEAPAAEPETTPAPAATPAPATKPASSEAQPGAGERSSGSSSESSSASTATKLPPIKHVFLVVLSDEPYAMAFGPASTAHYLASTLEHQGELLVRYDAVAHEELANEIALLSGQGPTPQTQANCPTYANLAPGGVGADEQALGEGCVYPSATKTVVGELAAKHLAWRAYVQGVDEPGATAGACAHPALGAADPSAEQTASTGPYATFRDPFVYFHSILDSPSCASDVVGLSRLRGDLAGKGAAPSLAYVVPDRCHDGNPTPCTPGAPAGMGPADTFLKQVVPQIERSRAYRDGGLIVITVDEAPSSGEYGDSSSCCGQPASYPNLVGKPSAFSGRGGGTVGALLISRYVKGGATSQEQANHYSLLRTIEDFFSLAPLGYSALPGVKALEPALFLAKPSG